MNFRRFGRLVIAVDTREVFQLSAPGFGIQAFLHRGAHTLRVGIDKNLDELVGVKQTARQLALRPERRNENDDHN